jgi:4-amino-4-deoxy-L-arabinose transferase-like glycosyltransferase
VARRRALFALLAAAAVGGVAERVAVYHSVLGKLDGDEAVWGLMARHAMHGHLSAFFWGQSHEGTQEVIVVAILFALVGTHVLAMRLVPIALTIATAFLVWRIGRRTLGEPQARVAALLMWVWPPYLIWKLDHWHGSYGTALLYSAALMLLALRIDECATRPEIALLGLVMGLSFWQTDEVIVVAVPVLVWLTMRRPQLWRQAWVAVPPLLLGLLPWLLSNLRHDWWSFTIGSGGQSYVTRFRGFFSAALPMILGLRVPFSVEWLDSHRLAQVAYVLLLAGFAGLAWRSRRTPLSLVVTVAALYPVVYSLSWRTSILTEPRYVVLLVPALALLLAKPASSTPRAALVLAAAGALTAVGFVKWVHWTHDTAPKLPDAQGVDVKPAIALLERDGLDRVWADYWVAYRITFDTRERVIAAEADLAHLVPAGADRVVPPLPRTYTDSRHPAYDTAVRDAPRHAYLLVRGAPATAADLRLLRQRGYALTRLADFDLLVSP